ncbi:MAG TPA: HPr family phosphocarrier protein [Candidatus Bariatricus faecipullorum]|nr:HPr family phosphocarrier protein [Candidatus Bariatricus faecipullorum]
MIKKPITIQLSDGLEARPIALLVQEASQYSSTIHIEVDNKKVNAKSIMGMMSLKVSQGEQITLVASGTDEEEAAKGIERFLINVKDK